MLCGSYIQGVFPLLSRTGRSYEQVPSVRTNRKSIFSVRKPYTASSITSRLKGSSLRSYNRTLCEHWHTRLKTLTQSVKVIRRMMMRHRGDKTSLIRGWRNENPPEVAKVRKWLISLFEVTGKNWGPPEGTFHDFSTKPLSMVQIIQERDPHMLSHSDISILESLFAEDQEIRLCRNSLHRQTCAFPRHRRRQMGTKEEP
mmetsp:Transcript_8672/g.12241  ORF Transcript_8672/g.12241 Transcript_8672/m.12241 type:complete len:200 (-) Transcript_8672:6-605(-)